MVAKYLNKVRKAKKRAYDSLLEEKKHEKSGHKNSGWMTQLFSTKPVSEPAEDYLKRKDHNLLKFYDTSVDTLKELITYLNIPKFEKSYISLIQQLNLRKW